MARVETIRPQPPRTRFRKACGCRVHYVVRLTAHERARGDIAPSTHCRKAAADREVTRIADQVARLGRAIGPGESATVGERADRWLTGVAGRVRNGRTLAPASVAAYRRNIDVHIRPAFGHLPMTAVSASAVNVWAARLGADPAISHGYLGQLAQTFRQIFDEWIRDGGRVTGGVNPVGPRIGGGSRHRTWTPRHPAEAVAIRDALPADLRALADVHRYTGCRGYCEVVALREDDLIFTRPAGESLADGLARRAAEPDDAYDRHPVRLRIDRKLEDDGTPGPLKTARTRRTIELDQWVIVSLASHLAQWPPRDGWLFYNTRPPHGPVALGGLSSVDRRRRAAALYDEGWSQGRIAAELGVGRSVIQRDLKHTTAAATDTGYSLGADGKRHPRQRADRIAATRGLRLATDDDALRLWRPWSYRRHLHLAADAAGVTLDEGQVGHLFRHMRCSELAAAGVDAASIAAFVGASVRTIQARYIDPLPESGRVIRLAIRATEEQARAARPALRSV